MTGTPAAQKLVKAQQKLADEDLRTSVDTQNRQLIDTSKPAIN
jgi:hypothetical protein